MEIKKLLPIGSIILLKEGKKRLMIFGIKQVDNSSGKEYDYIGELYPEGFLGEDYQYLFNHEDIEKVYFEGFKDDEREEFLNNLSDFFKKWEKSDK